MNTKGIEILIEKYFEGSTSLEEEKILSNFFKRENIPSHLAGYKSMFVYFNHEKETTLDSTTSNNLINDLRQSDKYRFITDRKFWFYFTGIAASIIFIVAIVFETQTNFISSENNIAGSTYSRQEAELAYLQTKAALGFVSEKYSQGVQPLGEIIRIGEGITTMREISKFDQQINNVATRVSKMDDGVNRLDKLSKISIFIKP